MCTNYTQASEVWGEALKQLYQIMDNASAPCFREERTRKPNPNPQGEASPRGTPDGGTPGHAGANKANTGGKAGEHTNGEGGREAGRKATRRQAANTQDRPRRRDENTRRGGGSTEGHPLFVRNEAAYEQGAPQGAGGNEREGGEGKRTKGGGRGGGEPHRDLADSAQDHLCVA